MKPLHLALVVVAFVALSVQACSRRESGAATNPAASVAGPTPLSGTMGASSQRPDESGTGNSSFAFPPRNESFLFRFLDLEGKYRDGLGRSPVSSFVDIEGTIVWTQEYLRYRLSNCSHADSTTRVFNQILGAGISPECGGSAPFPPRNEPLSFRQQLEVFYRDQLRRGPSTTFVDAEGDIVWTQEYPGTGTAVASMSTPCKRS